MLLWLAYAQSVQTGRACLSASTSIDVLNLFVLITMTVIGCILPARVDEAPFT